MNFICTDTSGIETGQYKQQRNAEWNRNISHSSTVIYLNPIILHKIVNFWSEIKICEGLRRPAIIILFIFSLFEAVGQADSLISKTPVADSVMFSEKPFSGELDISGRDSIPLMNVSDSLINLATDSLNSDTTKIASKTPKNDILTTINYSARDSIVFDVQNKKMLLFGKTHVDYGEVTLEADRTVINWEKRTINSTYSLDTTGRKVGKPVFSEGQDVYETNQIIYNFKSKRAIIKGVVTAQDGAFMHGDDVKKNEDDEMFIRGARYTTCNLGDPHFFIESQKIKVIPGNKVVSGPFNLKFREVPTPLWFPFGMFPQPRRKASGIIFPSYGEERVRGFFLRDMGYYFGFSDYADLKLTGALYSRGGHSLNANTNYKVRYKFNGSFNLSYNKSIGNSGDANEFETNDYSIRWTHRPLTRGNSSFSASVSAQTQSYNVNNNLVNQNFNRSINPQLTSNLSYTQKFSGTPFNLGLNGRHTQNLATGIVSMSLPDLTLNTARQFPLKRFTKNSSSPLAKLSFSHNFVVKNELTNNRLNVNSGAFNSVNVVNKNALSDSIVDFNLSNLDVIYDRAKFGGQHRIPLSTSFNVLKFLTVSPSFSYQEVWYTRELDYTYVPEENGIRIDTIQGFSRAGSWSSGASVNTRYYGTVFVKGKKIEAIRHVVTPSLSFSYNPDFGTVDRGVYDSVQVDSTGRKVRLSKYEGFAYGSPSGRESRTLSFSLTNNLEMKVRDFKDSTREFKKIKVFDNLAMNTGYNFAADSFKLNNINWNARTSFFKNAISLTIQGAFDPYIYKETSRRVSENGTVSINDRRLNQFAWNNGQGLGTLQSINSSVNFNFKPRNNNGRNDSQSDQNDANFGNQPDFTDPTNLENSPFGSDDEKAYVRQNPEQYVDFDVPWSLQLRYSINRRKNGLQEAQITQSTSFSGTLGLTDNTQITFQSGYDFKAKEITQTRIGVSRDLHCWTMNFSWVPFGTFQSFSLIIRPKSALLQDLKLERRRNFFDFFGE